MADIAARLRSAVLYEGHGEEGDLPEAAADEIDRLRDVLRTIVARADGAKALCEQGAPASANPMVFITDDDDEREPKG